MSFEHIKHLDRFLQPHDFSELASSPYHHPVDIDGFYELNGKGFVYIESKYGNKLLSKKQYRDLKDTVDMIRRDGKDGYLIIVQHNVTDPKEIVNEAESLVREVYFGNGESWRPLWNEKREIKLRDYWKELLAKYC